MARKVVWTPRAAAKFTTIVEYLEIEWSEAVTERFVKKTFSIIDLIADQPELGTLESRDKQISGFLLTKHNRLFYRVTDKEIILLNFFDTRSGTKRRKY